MAGAAWATIINRAFGESDSAAVKRTLAIAYITAFAVTFVCALGLYAARGSVGALFGTSGAASREVSVYLPLF